MNGSTFRLLASIGAISGVFCIAACRQVAGAEEAKKQPPADAAKDEVKTAHFLLHPAEAPYAALKYRLLASGIEQTPGNAAPHYFRAAMVWTSEKAVQDVLADDGRGTKLERWTALPLDELRKDQEAQDFFNSRPTGQWDLIRLAARREQCEWDLPIREFNISTLIPELKQMRELARLLAFKARIEISRGQFDQAIDTIKSGMALARHAANAPTLVNALVGIAVAQLMLNEVGELIEQPKCPNLYWTLTCLPEPFVDLRPGLEFERDFLYLYLPEWRDIHAKRTEAEWDRLLVESAKKIVDVMDGVAGKATKDWEWVGAGAYFAVTAYPKAKAQLREAGYTEAQIKEMGVSQAILTAEIETFNKQSDESHKWFYAEPSAAIQGLDETEKRFADWARTKQEIIPLASILLPALKNAKCKEVELSREVAAMRCLEAIRLYAAKHDGKLPAQLSEIHEVPVPNDPVTGKAFVYTGGGAGTAVLSSPAPSGRPASEGMRWEIEMAAAKG